MNRFCELVGASIPIVQAPTGSVAGPELASAVSKAGGCGALGLTWTTPEIASETVRLLVSESVRFLVNFALSFEPVSLGAALDSGAPIVTFSWGIDHRLISSCRKRSAFVGVQTAAVSAVSQALEAGAHFVILQGLEAGGHVQSTQALRVLLQRTRDELGDEPILVAAGGVATGADIAELLTLGADAVMLGTRFVATVESRAHPEYKQRLVESGKESTALTICFDGGWPNAPHRVLRNATLEQWEAAGYPVSPNRPGEAETVAYSVNGEPIYRYEDVAPRLGMTGDISRMPHYAGTGVEHISDLPTANELTRRLWAEAVASLTA